MSSPSASGRQPDDLDAFNGEDLIEAAGQLGVAIAEQEADSQAFIQELPGQVAGQSATV